MNWLAVISQNFSPTTSETVSRWKWPEYDPRLDTARILWRTETVFARAAHIYILRIGGKSIRTRRLDRQRFRGRNHAREKAVRHGLAFEQFQL